MTENDFHFLKFQNYFYLFFNLKSANQNSTYLISEDFNWRIICTCVHHCQWAEFQRTCTPRCAIHSSLKWVTPFLADYAAPWHLLAPWLFLLLKDIDAIPEFRGCVPWDVFPPRTRLGRLYPCLALLFLATLTVTTCMRCYASKLTSFKLKEHLRQNYNIFHLKYYQVHTTEIIKKHAWLTVN